MRNIILSSVVRLAVPYFFTISHGLHDFFFWGGEFIEHKICVLIFSTIFVLKHFSLCEEFSGILL